MLEVRALRKEFAAHSGDKQKVSAAVDDVSLAVQPGEFFTLLGPSGCGKTTTLRSVAGLEAPTSGTIKIAGVPVFDKQRAVPAHKRDIAMVFQSYAIWPHMTVEQNVAFPLGGSARVSRSERSLRVKNALRMVDLEQYARRPATALSGGQQQRVAFARAVVRQSKLLLLDEPLSNLDASLRVQMRRELVELQHTLKTTTIYVTHDQEEALSLSDRIAVMRAGKVLEVGTPEQLYLAPKHAFTAKFIGQAQLWPISRTADPEMVESPFGPLRVGPRNIDGELLLLVRPEHIAVDAHGEGQKNTFPGHITKRAFSGRFTELEIETAGGTVRAQELSGPSRQVGDRVTVSLPRHRCIVVASDATGLTMEGRGQ